jgi:formate hydrogenlyase transcriptional activator
MSEHAEKRIREILEFERLVSNLSSKFINVAVEEVDLKIHDALEKVAKFTKADRSFFFRYNKDKTEFRITHMWEADGITKDKELPGEIVKDYFPWLAAKLTGGSDVIIPDVEDLRAQDALPELDYCHEIGIQSFVVLPIQVADEPLCAIGLDAIRAKRQWPADIRNRLRVVGEVFTNAISRKHAQSALQEAFTEIKELKELLEVESSYLQEEIKLEHNFENIIGNSEALKYVLFQLEQVAPIDSPVLILGETGTGKELVARGIHQLSPRGDRALVKVNCPAIPGDLVESELFGHEKGAFTGAVSRQIGSFELARGSTIFLDEIGELPLALQPKLLRVLEYGEFERVGNPKTLKTNARIIAATNRDLQDEIAKGRFREDLYYRLKVLTLTLPTLRQRKTDIPLLVQWFIDKFARKLGKPAASIPSRAMQALQDYDWPGNVRELKHAVENALVTARGGKIKFDLPKNSSLSSDSFKSLEDMERDYIRKVLITKKWKIQGEDSAAAILRMHPNTLRARMNKLGISKPD